MRTDPLSYPLASNASATGSAVQIRGGEYMFFAEGTVGGSTISLQIQSPSGNWLDVGALAGSAIVKSTTLPYTASPIVLPACYVRMAATGGTPSALNASLTGIG
jgi:hypothetical protein